MAVAAGGEAVAVAATLPGNRLGRSGGAAAIDLGDEFEHLGADPAGRVWVAAGYEVWRLDPPGFRRAAAWASDLPARQTGATVWRLAPGRDGCLLGRRDGWLIAVDAAAREAGRAAVFADPVTALARPAAGGPAVAGSQMGKLAWLDPETLAVRRPAAAAHAGAVTPAGVAGSGLAASGGADAAVRLWTPAGDPILTLRLPAAVRNLALTPDGRHLFVLAAGERAVRRWHLGRLAAGLRDPGLDPGFDPPAGDD